MTIVIDTSGPAVRNMIAAASLVSLHRDLDLLLVGDEAEIATALSTTSHDPARLMVRHAAGGTACAVEVVQETPGAALVTAASAASVVMAAAEGLTLIEGARPALCAVYPTGRRRGARKDPFVLILDVGARFDAEAQDLVAYARMGAAYASRISRNPRPKVAVLAREIAGRLGPDEAVAAIAALEADPEIDCIGAVGGLEVSYGSADVIVTSGFLGNTVARLLEGVGSVAEQLAQSAQESSMRWRMAYKVIESQLDSMRGLTDWKEYGGAPLLGYERPVLVTAENAEPEALERAIRLAAKAIRLDVVGAVSLGIKA
jgi:phosphate acyltransferase